MQPVEVEVATIHDVKRPGLGNDLIENIHIVQLAIADVDEAGNIAAQVEQCMQLDRRFGRTKRNPRKHRQTQIDGGRIQRVDRLGEIDAKRLVHVKWPSYSDQALCKICIDAPISTAFALASVLRETLLRKPIW